MRQIQYSHENPDPAAAAAVSSRSSLRKRSNPVGRLLVPLFHPFPAMAFSTRGRVPLHPVHRQDRSAYSKIPAVDDLHSKEGLGLLAFASDGLQAIPCSFVRRILDWRIERPDLRDVVDMRIVLEKSSSLRLVSTARQTELPKDGQIAGHLRRPWSQPS